MKHRRLPLALALLALAGIAFAQDQVTVYAVDRDEGSVEFFASNRHVIQVYLQVTFPQLTNMNASVDLPYATVLEPGAQDVPLFTLTPTKTSGRVGYSLAYSYARGNPAAARHDDDHLYLIPFAHGSKYRLSQGFHGRFTHQGENEYAVDFEMDEGTEVYAARSGIVAEVKEDSRVGGTSASYGDDTNFILIQHADGSFANYAHLTYQGALVAPGDRVAAGDLIGYSGNTGRSSGPHLHFDVRMPTADGRMESIPFLFRGRDGEPEEPAEGRFYYAYHPGGPLFQEILGSGLSSSDYDGYTAPFPGDGVQVRVEQVDLTFVVFLQNGLATDQEVGIRLQLSGLSSDAGTTITRVVPAGTEVFATILRPLPGAARIQYGYTVWYGE